MKLKSIPLLLLLPVLILVLVGCGGEAAPLPTYTTYPTYTPYPTNTPVPSSPTSNNSSPTTYFEKGNDYLKRGDYQKAIEQYDEAIRLDPQDTIAYYNRGILYGLIGKTIEAERDFAKAKELGYDP